VTSDPSAERVIRWLGGLPALLRAVIVAGVTAGLLALMLLKFSGERDVPIWEMPPNRDGLWTVVEHPDGTAEISRGMPRVMEGDTVASFGLTFRARATGSTRGDLPTPLTAWLERSVKVDRPLLRPGERLDPAVENRLLGHLAARFSDPDLAGLIARGGGKVERTSWGWLTTFVWIGLITAGVVEALVWAFRHRGKRRAGSLEERT